MNVYIVYEDDGLQGGINFIGVYSTKKSANQNLIRFLISKLELDGEGAKDRICSPRTLKGLKKEYWNQIYIEKIALNSKPNLYKKLI